MITELGRTQLYTRRQRARLAVAVLAVLLGTLLAAWLGTGIAAWLSGLGWQSLQVQLRPPVTPGSGGLLGVPVTGQPNPPSHPQFPLAVQWPPVPGWAATLAAAPVWLAWTWRVVWPLLRGLARQPRHRGRATRRSLRRSMSAAAARRAGRFTRPTLAAWHRMVLASSEFGFRLGYPLQHRWMRLWADWEQRLRVIARTGWGKTARILVPIIRTLPGPALISSTEPEIFQQTVTARRFRRTVLRWTWLDTVCRRWLQVREYAVAVADFSAPTARYAAGYPQVQFDPIDGCASFALAHRRGAALVSGVEAETDRGSDNDSMFRDAATEVLASWLHAADLGDFEIEHLQQWLADTQDPRPRRVLNDDPRADPSARNALGKHLDKRAEKTTSGVERYLALALQSLTSTEGRGFCGARFDRSGQRRARTFDITEFVERGGTIYVLADAARIDRFRPLLSLFCNEVFFAAEAAALRRRGPIKRLPKPFIGVLDELRYGVAISSLPYIASTMRKFNVGYVYSVQSSSQEEALYGPEAQALRDAAGVSVYGGIDITAARELADRAGTTPVVTPSHGDLASQSLQQQDALTIADQQELADGQSVIIARGLRPFLAYTPSFREHRRTRRQITRESEQVAREVAAAQARQDATHHSRENAARAGADVETEYDP